MTRKISVVLTIIMIFLHLAPLNAVASSTATPSTATPSTATPSTATPSTATPSTATPSTATPSTAATYYYFADDGDDEHDGLTEDTPWKSLSKSEDIELHPGDGIFLKSNSSFSGTLKLSGSGDVENPILVSSYGDGERPIIRGTGENPSDVIGAGNNMTAVLGTNPVPNAAIHLYNTSNIVVSGIEVTNLTDGRTVEDTSKGQGNYLAGVIVENNDAETLSGIVLDNLYIHDVTGFLDSNNKSKMTGGLGFVITGISEAKKSPRFEDVIIENTTIERVNSTGLFFDGYFEWQGNTSPNQFYGFSADAAGNPHLRPVRPDTVDNEADRPKNLIGTDIKRSWNDMKWSNIIIRNNRIGDTGKNGVIIRMTDETCVVEKNIIHDVSYREGAGNALMSRSAYGTVFQYNEIYANRESNDQDGSALDADFYSPATVWQYNYSHDNNYGLMTFCTVESDHDIKVRYNIDLNGRGRILNLNYNFTNLEIYNNFFYIGKEITPAHGSSGISPIWETFKRSTANYTGKMSYKYYNNIVYSDNLYVTYSNMSPDGKRNGSQKITRQIFNNIFYGIGADPSQTLSYGIGEGNQFIDPMVFMPGTVHTTSEVSDGWKDAAWDALKVYYLRSGNSPAIDAGSETADDIETDFFGNTLSGIPDIGPYEYRAEDSRGYPSIALADVAIKRSAKAFDPLEGISAATSQGEPIPSDEIEVSGVVQSNLVGTYFLVYQVRDHISGQTMRVRRTVTVTKEDSGVLRIPAKQDSWITDGKKDSNFSQDKVLGLKQGNSSNHRISYLMFDLSDVSMDQSMNAELRLVVENAGSGEFNGILGLFEADPNTDLSTLTWNSVKPDMKNLSTVDDNFITGIAVSSPKASDELIFDITDFVLDQADKGKTSFVLQLVPLFVSVPYNTLHSIESNNSSARPVIQLTSAINLGEDSKAESISLSLNEETLALQPDFSKDVFNYTLKIPANASLLKAEIIHSDEKASGKYEIYLDESTAKLDNDIIILGAGDHNLRIVVFAENEDIKTEYHFELQRLIDYDGFDPNDFKKERYQHVEVLHDIPYATVENYRGDEIGLKMDLYRPLGEMNIDRPVVVFVHGGGFLEGTSKEEAYIVELANRYAKMGYVSVSIDYRLRTGMDMTEKEDEVLAMYDASQDLNTALVFLRKHANYYGFNPNYILTVGGSSGGMVVVGYSYAESGRNFNYDGLVATGILWGCPDPAFDANYRLKKDKPTLILHGDMDTNIAYQNSVRFYDRLRDEEHWGVNPPAKRELNFVSVPGGDQALENITNRFETYIIPSLNDIVVENLKFVISRDGFKPAPAYIGQDMS